MDAERRRFAGWQSELIGWQALFVEAVPRFVEDAKEGVAEVVKVVARGDALIARPGAGAEGMVRDVESAGAIVKSDRCGGCFAERLLDVDGKLALEELAVRLARAC